MAENTPFKHNNLEHRRRRCSNSVMPVTRYEVATGEDQEGLVIVSHRRSQKDVERQPGISGYLRSLDRMNYVYVVAFSLLTALIIAAAVTATPHQGSILVIVLRHNTDILSPLG